MLEARRWGPAGGGQARQLVVLLHGVGADAQDLIGLAPHFGRSLPDAAFASFDAPEPYDMAPPGLSSGRQWFSLQDRTPISMQAGAARAAPALEAAIDAELTRTGAQAVAIAGFSQGAMMALYAGLRRPAPPRAIIAYSGALLDVPSPVPSIPVLLVHGEEDNVVPVERSRQAEALLRAAGLEVEAMYRPGLMHGIDEPGLNAGSLFLQRAFAAG